MLDTEGFEIGPLVEAAAAKYSIPGYLLLAMLKAESGLNRTAARYGTWPDVSFGYLQMIVATAAGYGIGNGTNTESNIELVRDKLFDRNFAIDLGAKYLSLCYQGDDLQALIAYNSGSPQPEGNWYWLRYRGNIASYEAALAWAKEQYIA